jgi:hypothetical protein
MVSTPYFTGVNHDNEVVASVAFIHSNDRAGIKVPIRC